jgi:hypothetical protein
MRVDRVDIEHVVSSGYPSGDKLLLHTPVIDQLSFHDRSLPALHMRRGIK